MLWNKYCKKVPARVNSVLQNDTFTFLTLLDILAFHLYINIIFVWDLPILLFWIMEKWLFLSFNLIVIATITFPSSTMGTTTWPNMASHNKKNCITADCIKHSVVVQLGCIITIHKITSHNGILFYLIVVGIRTSCK